MREKPDHFYRQSAVIPYRLRHGKPEILLITSRHKRRWVIPKGIIEPDLSPAASAAKEALEEAGVEGRVGAEPLGSYQYDKWGGTCSVEVFVLEVDRVHDEWAEANRQRLWLSPAEAAERVDEEDLARLITDFSSSIGETAGDDRSPEPG
ncbi:MAG: NUDIX hydrolase [Thermoanaerobaculia bacterium]